MSVVPFSEAISHKLTIKYILVSTPTHQFIATTCSYTISYKNNVEGIKQVKKLRVKDMNELYHKLLVTLLFVVPLVFLQVGGKVCYIAQSSRDKIEDSGDDNVIQWQKITNTQIALCTKLQFLPNNYTLIKSLEIIAVSNFMINGNGAIFHCNSSSLIVSNSTRVQIMNATFTNCGYAVNNFVTPRNLFPSLTKAAIILHNSFTIIVKNVIFENNPGYAIIGVNVMGESYYANITVTFLSLLTISRKTYK